MTSAPVITINLDKSCAECGKPGAVDNGLCLVCSTRAMTAAWPMRSIHGRAVQERFKRILQR